MIKITPYTIKHSLNESYSRGMRFTLLNLKEQTPEETHYEEITPKFFCKDYFQDIFAAQYKEHDPIFSVYGYMHDITVPIVDSDLIHIKISFAWSTGFISSYSNNIPIFLNKFEEKLSFRKTTIEKLTKDNYVVHFSREWTTKPALLSLFLLLLRISWKYKEENLETFLKTYSNNDSDGMALKTIYPKLDLLLNNPEIFKEILPYWSNWRDEGIFTIHNNSGIVSTNLDLQLKQYSKPLVHAD